MKLVGIGLEELGVEEFVKGDFFKGDLYLDTKKEAYKAIGYKRLGIFGALSTILEKKVRALFERAKKENITGNMAGDKFQFGGTLVVDKGGKVLLNYKQESAADHVANDDVLKALGLTPATSGKMLKGRHLGVQGPHRGLQVRVQGLQRWQQARMRPQMELKGLVKSQKLCVKKTCVG